MCQNDPWFSSEIENLLKESNTAGQQGPGFGKHKQMYTNLKTNVPPLSRVLSLNVIWMNPFTVQMTQKFWQVIKSSKPVTTNDKVISL